MMLDLRSLTPYLSCPTRILSEIIIYHNIKSFCKPTLLVFCLESVEMSTLFTFFASPVRPVRVRIGTCSAITRKGMASTFRICY
jgi:hypothetical protein